MTNQTVENYLKCIYSLQEGEPVSTNAIAERMDTKASSVTDMLKKLSSRGLVNYVKYQGVSLTKDGQSIAVRIIRKHRLWEVFLVEKLSFKWDEVHVIAEQLEHIDSPELTRRLDEFLDFPRYDPHGDPIPDEQGRVLDKIKTCALSELVAQDCVMVVGVNDSSAAFLQYLEKMNLVLGTQFTVEQVIEYDKSVCILVEGKSVQLSQQVAKNLNVKKV